MSATATLTETTLPCGCRVLADADGPSAVLEPCADYPPDDQGGSLHDVHRWAEQLAKQRAGHNRAREAKRAGRKATA